MPRLPRFLLPSLLALLLLTLPSVVAAGPSPVPVPPEVQAQLAVQGTVRVIVRLADPVLPDLPAGIPETIPSRAVLQEWAAIQALQDQVLAAVQAAGATTPRVVRYQALPLLALTTNAAGVDALAQSPLVRNIGPDQLRRPLDLQSNLIMGASTPATGAWALGYTGAGWHVAVLDTGAQSTPVHPFLAGKIAPEHEFCYSAVPTPEDPTISSLCPNGLATQEAVAGAATDCPVDPAPDKAEGCGHGTHVSGIAVGRDYGGGPGYDGIAKDAALLSFQVFHRESRPSVCGEDKAPCVQSLDSNQILALDKVLVLHNTPDGPRIGAVNMSLGSGNFSTTCDAGNQGMKTAIDALRAVGIPTIIAAGNDGKNDQIGAPACISSAISVASSAKFADGGTERVSDFSDWAPFVSLVATGSDINSSVPVSVYKAEGGTSMAAPAVAGAWTLMRQAKPTASVAEILRAFQASGVPLSEREAKEGEPGPTPLPVARPRIDLARAIPLLLGPTAAVPQVFRSAAGGW